MRSAPTRAPPSPPSRCSGLSSWWLRAAVALGPVGLSRLGIVLHACEVEHHTWLVPDHPSVVAGRNGNDIAGTELELGAVDRRCCSVLASAAN
jgi:hypothetical protein